MFNDSSCIPSLLSCIWAGLSALARPLLPWPCAKNSAGSTTSVRPRICISFTNLNPPFLLSFCTATVTNDIFTREDQEFLIKNKALPASRILAIETGGCPHAAIREDISANMGALETLQAKYGCQILFVESGGDNLAANYSRELADYIIYVIDVSVSCDPRNFIYI